MWYNICQKECSMWSVEGDTIEGRVLEQKRKKILYPEYSTEKRKPW